VNETRSGKKHTSFYLALEHSQRRKGNKGGAAPLYNNTNVILMRLRYYRIVAVLKNPFVNRSPKAAAYHFFMHTSHSDQLTLMISRARTVLYLALSLSLVGNPGEFIYAPCPRVRDKLEEMKMRSDKLSGCTFHHRLFVLRPFFKTFVL
jgi:hypothetical protein